MPKLFLIVVTAFQCTRVLRKRYLYSALIAMALMSIMVSGCGRSEQEMRDEYVKSAVQVDYNDIIRNPNRLKGKVLIFTGKVSFVRENYDNVELMVIVGREGITDLPVWVNYHRNPNEERIIEGDTIRVWGIFDKVESHTTNSLIQISCPDILAKYVERQKVVVQTGKP